MEQFYKKNFFYSFFYEEVFLLVTFRFVENKDPMDIYNVFKEDFLNPHIHVPELRKKYDLSPSNYNYLRKQVLNETGLAEKPFVADSARYRADPLLYLTKNKNNSYRIYKVVDGVKTYFGTYKDLETAQKVRDKLIKYNWDKDKAEDLKKKYSVTSVKPKLDEALKQYDDFEKMFLEGYTRSELNDYFNFTNYQYDMLSRIIREKYNISRKKIRKRN